MTYAVGAMNPYPVAKSDHHGARFQRQPWRFSTALLAKSRREQQKRFAMSLIG